MTEYNLTAYLIIMGFSLVCACLLFAFSVRKRQVLPAGKAFPLGMCVLVLAPVFGILGAKLFYFIFRLFYLIEMGAGEYWLSLRTEELSYYGGIAGVTLSVSLAAAVFRLSPKQTLNSFAAAGALLAAAARFAECCLFPTGLGTYLENPLPFPLAVNVVYSEDYSESILAVYMFEGFFSLAAFVLSLVHRKEPHRFIRTLFYLCLPQIILESLRTDTIDILLLHAEQLVCYLFVQGVLVWYAFANGRHRFSSWVPAVTGLVVCGFTVVEEFMLEGKILVGGDVVPRWITYTAMAAGLVAIAVAEHRADRRFVSQSL